MPMADATPDTYTAYHPKVHGLKPCLYDAFDHRIGELHVRGPDRLYRTIIFQATPPFISHQADADGLLQQHWRVGLFSWVGLDDVITATVSTILTSSITTSLTDTLTLTLTNDVTTIQETTLVDGQTATSTFTTDTTITTTASETTTITVTASTVTIPAVVPRSAAIDERGAPPKKPACPKECANTLSFSSACACIRAKTSTVHVAGPTVTVTRNLSAVLSTQKIFTQLVTLTTSVAVTNSKTSVQTDTSTSVTILITADVKTSFVTTTTTLTSTETQTPSCSLSTSTAQPTNYVVNANLDSNWQSSFSDGPWTIVGGGASYYNGAQYAQSAPIFWFFLKPSLPKLCTVTDSASSCTLYQDIVLPTDTTYTVSAYIRPYALYPVPYDSSVPQYCTFSLNFGSGLNSSETYTQSNGTVSGYRQISFSGVRGYVGNGIVDTVSVTAEIPETTSLATKLQNG
ncbi:uncharacterized protein MYCFIDRAFT_174536 [Pseudocercospora fijiensis CIRAD86]|uniref:Uncharacterized protein n=1 Tax=Pseudocercospora fijiensis (strain CIRAD86) TaxID=383855 RepID=M3B0X0_PSEFD|nr:uncharacterized protein MYCFIDRAFT_174536 [Pseudocercospora fijiensis CIRAD86]EME83048.1 hypothetical protein MYCFIDRAFT_174536 [Pseudocercospora fijiensis CIRAD86]